MSIVGFDFAISVICNKGITSQLRIAAEGPYR